MGNRSNINLVGNTTQGQNVGIGTDIFKGKNVGNTLQYKTLSVTGTTMVITSDADNIYFSANTGGGGGSVISGTTTYLSMFNSAEDNIENSHLYQTCSCVGTFVSNNVCSLGSCNAAGIHAFNFGASCTCYLYFTYSTGSNSGPQINADSHTLRLRGSRGLFTFDNPLTINTQGSANTQMIIDNYGSYNSHQLTYVGGDNYDYNQYGYSIGLLGGAARSGYNLDGGDVVLKPGAGDGSGDTGRVIMDGLPVKSSETCGLWIDASGNLSTGFISGSSGNSVWTQNGGFVHPDTATDGVIITDNECYAWSGGSYIHGNAGSVTLKGNSPTSGVGGGVSICGGISNDANGGDILILAGSSKNK